MHRLIVFLSLIGLAVGQIENLPQSACDFCHTVAPRISNFIAAGMSEVDIVAKLKQGCAEIEQLSPEIRAKCDGFVGVYVDYMADMITATTNPEEFCISFGLCESNVDEPEYTIIFPSIYENNVTYNALSSNPRNSYKYKIFLGNSSELFADHMVSLTYRLVFEQPETIATMEIRSPYNKVQCSQDEECFMEMVNPQDGTWYFIDITTGENAAPFQSINFTATEQKWTHQTTFVIRRHSISLVSFLLLVSTVGAVLCLCISCCLRLRKGKLERSRRCRNIVIEQGPTEYVADYNAQYPMVGYYYFPSQEANQMDLTEMQVPQYWTPIPPQAEPQAPSIDQMN